MHNDQNNSFADPLPPSAQLLMEGIATMLPVPAPFPGLRLTESQPLSNPQKSKTQGLFALIPNPC